MSIEVFWIDPEGRAWCPAWLILRKLFKLVVRNLKHFSGHGFPPCFGLESAAPGGFLRQIGAPNAARFVLQVTVSLELLLEAHEQTWWLAVVPAASACIAAMRYRNQNGLKGSRADERSLCKENAFYIFCLTY
jgi:hypothetical protein